MPADGRGDCRLLRERLDRVDALSGKVEHDPARHEQRQARRPGEQVDEGRRGGAQVLGVVESEQQLARRSAAAASPAGRAGELMDAERAGDRPEHEAGSRSGASSTNAAPLAKSRRLAGRLEREPRLPGAARSGQHEQPHLGAEQKLAQLVRARARGRAAGSGRGQRARRGVRGGATAELRVVLEDPPLQLAQLGARLEPELVAQRERAAV